MGGETDDGTFLEAALRDCALALPTAARAACDSLRRFARIAEEIADDMTLPAERRIALLDGLDALLDGRKPAVPLALPLASAANDLLQTAASAGADARPARHLLQARRQDCTKARYRDWADWLAYVRYAAAPHGRFLIEAAHEDKTALPAIEALCCALSLIDRIGRCGDDFRARGRVYLPERWLRDHGATAEDLAAGTASPALRAVFAEAAGATGRLSLAAAPLPGLIRAPQLRGRLAKAAILVRRMTLRLADSDPLRDPIRLRDVDRWIARAYGAWRRIA